MWMTAIKNFETVDKILASQPPAFESATTALADEDLREAMRYQASEVNRLFFNGWGLTQLALGLATLVLAWSSDGGRVTLGCVLGAFVIAVFLQAITVPETIRIGRIIDFGGGSTEQTATFWHHHHSYTGLDMAKFVLLLVGLGSVVLRSEAER